MSDPYLNVLPYHGGGKGEGQMPATYLVNTSAILVGNFFWESNEDVSFFYIIIPEMSRAASLQLGSHEPERRGGNKSIWDPETNRF